MKFIKRCFDTNLKADYPIIDLQCPSNVYASIQKLCKDIILRREKSVIVFKL